MSRLSSLQDLPMSRSTVVRTLTVLLAILVVGFVLSDIGVILGSYGIDIHLSR